MNGVISQAGFELILLKPPFVDIRPCPGLCRDKGNGIPDGAAGSSGSCRLSSFCFMWCSLEVIDRF